LQAAFNRCESAICPLTDRQKNILLQVVEELTQLSLMPDTIAAVSHSANPLDELTLTSATAFAICQIPRAKKIALENQLLNDWLQERDSGQMQFIRERYGPQWLNRIKPEHFNKYADEERKLKAQSGRSH
jgi:hypothetical protein